MDEFNVFIESTRLMELRSKGNHFSWCNGQEGLARRWSRLDRSLVNAAFLELFPNASMQYLSRRTSDHSPLLIRLEEFHSSYGFPPFKFHQMWVTHESFLSCIAGAWEDDIEDFDMVRLAQKLKRLKPILRVWNRDVFGNIKTQMGYLEERLAKLENKLQVEFHAEDEQDYLVTKAELDVWSQQEEICLCQQAKQSWLSHGEALAQFFRSFKNINSKVVREMKLQNGTWLKSPEEVHKGAVEYFTKFLVHNQVEEVPNLVGLIQPSITDEENNMLGLLPSIQNVKKASFAIPVDSSPGLDGFGSRFYQAC
ncbi:hypothetical protein I3760_08G064400 [Carya illinoinensis]|uniref:Uncharacterized protein n=1 Tax=Carya illinoinensis TaxID=32201 RepID=A0A8T1PUJ9_CARIL|nr:hypothetical protein I3760_08G064400 [Carya illinoinensis]KAG6644572.1 hypothetical protein CIPAW_08G063100 [Carya illinoinensis]